MDHSCKPLFRKEKVDESGACNFYTFERSAVQMQIGADCFRYFFGSTAKCARTNHGGICGKIAMGGIRGNLNNKFRQFAPGSQCAGSGGLFERLCNKGGN